MPVCAARLLQVQSEYPYAQVTLRIVKTSNATYGHHGEMAHGQFYYAS